ncbi:MAG TPA: hypothetical protein DCZ41_03670 [Firmicutes bacterium]|nr:hypothetical protein [Bacillota bacterium]
MAIIRAKDWKRFLIFYNSNILYRIFKNFFSKRIAKPLFFCKESADWKLKGKYWQFIFCIYENIFIEKQ